MDSSGGSSNDKGGGRSRCLDEISTIHFRHSLSSRFIWANVFGRLSSLIYVLGLRELFALGLIFTEHRIGVCDICHPRRRVGADRGCFASLP